MHPFEGKREYPKMGLPEFPSRRNPSLSRREKQVLELIVEGVPVKEIAYTLAISRNTAAQYQQSLHAKLGVHSRGALALWGFRERLLARRAA
jgi:DNA-binding CsgD family transcriptional regulator